MQSHCLRSWNFEGSVDGVDWAVLDARKDCPDITDEKLTRTWAIEAKERKTLAQIAYTKFRVVMTGQDSNGDFSLWLAAPGLELYGTLFENYTPPAAAAAAAAPAATVAAAATPAAGAAASAAGAAAPAAVDGEGKSASALPVSSWFNEIIEAERCIRAMSLVGQVGPDARLPESFAQQVWADFIETGIVPTASE